MSFKLRLAILGDSTHPNIERWNSGLRSAGAETCVVSLRHRAGTPRFPTFWLPTFRRLGRYTSYVLASPCARRFLRQWQPDIVLAYYVTGYGTLAQLCGVRPLVQVTSGSDVLIAPRQRLLKVIVRHNLSKADLVTSWAPHMAKAARDLGAGEVFILPAGIDTNRFRAHLISKPTREDIPRFIATRALKPGYRIDLLIEAARILKENRGAFFLTIVGDGPDRSRLTRMVEDYKLQDSVSLTGFVSNSDLPLLLSQHNLYISPVPSDGVSASLLEAMAAGLLPIVPQNHANSDWISHGENGYLFYDDTPVAIAALIEHIGYEIRARAWEQNPVIVSERADLYRNSQRYVSRFYQLIGER